MNYAEVQYISTTTESILWRRRYTNIVNGEGSSMNANRLFVQVENTFLAQRNLKKNIINPAIYAYNE